MLQHLLRFRSTSLPLPASPRSLPSANEIERRSSPRSSEWNNRGGLLRKLKNHFKSRKHDHPRSPPHNFSPSLPAPTFLPSSSKCIPTSTRFSNSAQSIHAIPSPAPLDPAFAISLASYTFPPPRPIQNPRISDLQPLNLSNSLTSPTPLTPPAGTSTRASSGFCPRTQLQRPTEGFAADAIQSIRARLHQLSSLLIGNYSRLANSLRRSSTGDVVEGSREYLASKVSDPTSTTHTPSSPPSPLLPPRRSAAPPILENPPTSLTRMITTSTQTDPFSYPSSYNTLTPGTSPTSEDDKSPFARLEETFGPVVKSAQKRNVDAVRAHSEGICCEGKE